jgi:hypothetical protein
MAALKLITMSPSVLSTTVTGDPATKWRRFAAVIIVRPEEVAMHLGVLTDPPLLPTRCRLFRRIRVLVARDHVEVQSATNILSVCPGSSPMLSDKHPQLVCRKCLPMNLKLPKNLSMILLGIGLILMGLISGLGTLMAILAIAICVMIIFILSEKAKFDY